MYTSITPSYLCICSYLVSDTGRASSNTVKSPRSAKAGRVPSPTRGPAKKRTKSNASTPVTPVSKLSHDMGSASLGQNAETNEEETDYDAAGELYVS